MQGQTCVRAPSLTLTARQLKEGHPNHVQLRKRGRVQYDLILVLVDTLQRGYYFQCPFPHSTIVYGPNSLLASWPYQAACCYQVPHKYEQYLQSMRAGAVKRHGGRPVASYAAHSLGHGGRIILFIPIEIILRHWEPVTVPASNCCFMLMGFASKYQH